MHLNRLLGLLIACTAAVMAAVAAAAATDGLSPEDGYLPVPVVTIHTGETIDDAMIEERRFPTAVRVRMAVIEARGPLIGKVARRTLAPGKPIPISAVAEPLLVTRGVPTRAVFRSGGIHITAIAMPIRSGSLGEYVQLRNLDSGQLIAGTVQADGTVLVGGGL